MRDSVAQAHIGGFHAAFDQWSLRPGRSDAQSGQYSALGLFKRSGPVVLLAMSVQRHSLRVEEDSGVGRVEPQQCFIPSVVRGSIPRKYGHDLVVIGHPQRIEFVERGQRIVDFLVRRHVPGTDEFSRPRDLEPRGRARFVGERSLLRVQIFTLQSSAQSYRKVNYDFDNYVSGYTCFQPFLYYVEGVFCREIS